MSDNAQMIAILAGGFIAFMIVKSGLSDYHRSVDGGEEMHRKLYMTSLYKFAVAVPTGAIIGILTFLMADVMMK